MWIIFLNYFYELIEWRTGGGKMEELPDQLTFAKLYGCDKGTTFKFFKEHLLDAIEEAEDPPVRWPTRQEVGFVTSVLFDFAITPIDTSDGMLKPKDLEVVTVILLRDLAGHRDAELIELAAGQVLFWNGFYREHVRQTQSIRQYDVLGRFLFEKAAKYYNDPEHRFIMEHMSDNFTYWARRCRDIQRVMN